MEIKIHTWLTLFSLATCLTTFAAFQEQSRFVGPLELKVWKHWQPSWNVEAETSPRGFSLIRSIDGERGQVSLTLYDQRKTELKGILRCEALKRTDTWKVELKTGREFSTVNFQNPQGDAQFIWDNSDDCVDVSEKNITQKLSVRVTDKQGKELFSYSVSPMYVRGKNQSYWNNPISSFSAHAGTGNISIATLLSGENGWDQWNGTLVKPILSFADRNTMKAGALVGLHRHEANQEIYLIESGQAEMVMGVAARVSDSYKTMRPWDEKGEKKETDEFAAQGGWKETRFLNPAEAAIIVPSPTDKNTVYFHGINARTDVVFWTMGSRN